MTSTSTLPPSAPPMLVIAQELARFDGASSGLLDPAAFVSALSQLSNASSHKPEEPHPSAPGPVGALPTDVANFASSLRSHAIETLVKFGPSDALLQMAQACERLAAPEQAQTLLQSAMGRAASEKDAALFKALAGAGAACSTKHSVGTLCAQGGAELLNDPVIAALFAKGVEREFNSPASSYSSKPSVSFDYLDVHVLARAPGSFTESLIAICASKGVLLELHNLYAGVKACDRVKIYFEKKDDAAFWASRGRHGTGTGKCPHDFSERESDNAMASKKLFARALNSAIERALDAPEGSEPRLGAVEFLAFLGQKNPRMLLGLAALRPDEKFSAREIKHSDAGAEQLQLDKETQAAAFKKPRLGYFELAFFNKAADSTLQAIAARLGRPNTELIDELAKSNAFPYYGGNEQRQLWLQSLAGTPHSSTKRPVARI